MKSFRIDFLSNLVGAGRSYQDRRPHPLADWDAARSYWTVSVDNLWAIFCDFELAITFTSSADSPVAGIIEILDDSAYYLGESLA